MFKQFTSTLPEFDMSSFKMPTANEVVEASRSISTAAINLIPHVDTKDSIARVANATLSIVTLYADQVDNFVGTVSQYLKPVKA